jgi:SAM-dependent methyltransferase
MSTWKPIQYRQMHDVPRAIIVSMDHRLYYLNSRFLDDLDEYDDHYDVFAMGELSEPQLKGSWENLEELATAKVGRIPVRDVRFDRTRRQIDIQSVPLLSPLHNLDPTTRFTDRADDYAKFRPTYPPEAISFILSQFAPRAPEELTAADIGAGTGISSRLLADQGVRVAAVEPNAAMREAAEPHPRVDFRPGTAEATGLKDASIDLVLCAQAFHWFDYAKALPELRRILSPRGRLILMWNDRDPRDPLTAEYGKLILEASGFHPAAKDRSDSASVLDATPLFTPPRVHSFPSEQPLTLEGLIGRATSASYCPKEGPKLDTLIEGLTDLHRLFADLKGLVRMVYATRVYVARPRDPAEKT